MRTILQTTSVAEFRKLMQKCISWMLSDSDLETFGHYFQTYYAKRTEEWAYCYRVGTPVNTNMSVEAFHRLLKVVYLESKHNRRVDHLLSVLLRIARDKLFDRLVKLEKGKSTHRTGEINRRHRSAIEMIDTSVTVVQVKESLWQVSSASRDYVQYLVRKQCTHCECKVQCGSCGVCVHMYTCACVDCAVHSTACKHIHVIHMKYCKETPNQVSEADKNLPSSSTENAAEEILTLQQLSKTLQQAETLDNDGKLPLDKLKREFQGLVSQAQTLAYDSTDCDVLKACITHLRSAVGVMKSMKSTRKREKLTIAASIAPNTNSPCQARFHSTKKRRVYDVHGLSKPTAIQMDKCKDSLSDEPVKICGACFKEEDIGNDSESISWVQCSNCSIWLHTACVHRIIENAADFICQYCIST